MASASQKQLAALKKDVQEVNWARKNQQTNVGEKLRQLEVNYINYFIIIKLDHLNLFIIIQVGWVGLVSKNYEIEQALVNLESELKQRSEVDEEDDGMAQ